MSRVFSYTRLAAVPPQTDGALDVAANFARLPLPDPANELVRWQARWPGTYGRALRITVDFLRSKNVLVGGRLTGVVAGRRDRADSQRNRRSRTGPCPATARSSW